MNIALIGYGKMGHAIETLALEADHKISFRIDEANNNQISDLSPVNTDIAIEFSDPEKAVENIKTCIKNKVPVVSGTTGWLDSWDEIDAYCSLHKGTFFYASNYSIGVNLFFKLNEYVSKLMKKQEYGVSLEEIHHTEKKDSPSGTAITLSEPIIEERTIETWVNHKTDNRSELGIISKREKNVPGTHTITYSSEVDEISFSHVAHSRKGFAKGALAVAEWIVNSPRSGMLSMKDFLTI